MKYRIYFAGILLDLVLLLILLYGGLTFTLRDVAEGAAPGPYLANAVYVLMFGGLFILAHFPLQVFIGYHWEHKFGFSNQNFGQWSRDELKKILLNAVLTLVLVEVMYALLRHFPLTWWIFTGGFWFLLSFVLAKLTPTVIVPLFYKYKAIKNEPLKQRIKALFRDCRVGLHEVYAIDYSRKTSKANAFICGLGASRRVILSDTLLDEFAEREIETVVAHELGHYCHRDILKMLAINSVLIFSGLYIIDRILTHAVGYFGFRGTGDIAALPLLVLIFSAYALVLTPLTNWLSCRMEVAADRFSLEHTGDPGAFIAMMDKLGRRNLAEVRPNKWIEWFFYDHPPLEKRIAFAKTFQETRDT
ncbi:MAG: M48 family metallopeptidase [Candidatus Omnitrophica bacterium]|nr:M48 family metallopeptidase [Candidatus Omnitrophota bacterium]